MKRVYKKAERAPVEGGYAVMLDGRAARTPAKRPLILPTAALAEAVAAEWDAQGDEVRPEAMPLTRLAATAIDHVSGRREAVVDEISAYATTDLVCHRADAPADLVAHQRASWQPLLDWVEARYGARLEVTSGVMPLAQPDGALDALRAAAAGYDDFALAALRAIAAVCGSLVIALALAEDRIDAETAWRLSQIDESHQIERWGEDSEAAGRRARTRGVPGRGAVARLDPALSGEFPLVPRVRKVISARKH